MFVTEIYRDTLDTNWKNDETFLCVFDEQKNIIAQYTLCNGLRLMKDEKNITVYINNSDLISGKWIFFGSKVHVINDEIIQENVVQEGYSKNGSGKLEPVSWSNCFPKNQVSKKEIDNRLLSCFSCPLLDKINMRCTINHRLVLEFTRHEDEFCPEEKWGSKEDAMKKRSENATIIVHEQDKEEQEQFEKELEEYLKGL